MEGEGEAGGGEGRGGEDASEWVEGDDDRLRSWELDADSSGMLHAWWVQPTGL